ncbi:MAG TPA: methyltransferase domain-containing protein [Candidatus Angelobacter sp.]|nr:methyltransferase domain-containing protein [Candidatus Angelobacter sp.]
MPQSRVSQFFDGYARDFDAIYSNKNGWFHSTINKLFRRSMARRYRKTLEGCSPIAGRSVLDIGCGPGHYSVALARRGASEVLGIDFADGMLQIAHERAVSEGLTTCRFEKRDFLNFDFGRKFDYSIVMGFMDYASQPAEVVKKTLSLTAVRAFFSFPVAGGFLAWQRNLRYKSRCELYTYTEGQVRQLFANHHQAQISLENLGRDLFVTAEMK